jgi:DNA-binding IclR family transcriptional regulator
MTKDVSGPLDRYLSILELVAASKEGLTLSQITTLLDLPKPTGHRLVSALREAGALGMKDDGHKAFSLGPRVERILALTQDRNVVANCAKLVCEELAAEMGETAYVARLASDCAETIAVATPTYGYQLHVVPWANLPMHAAAASKILLAFQSESMRRRYLSADLPKFTPYTKCDVDELMAELSDARSNRYASCIREIEPEFSAYACPVDLPAGVFYAIGVTGPASRLEARSLEDWLEPLRKGGAKLATMLVANRAATKSE